MKIMSIIKIIKAFPKKKVLHNNPDRLRIAAFISIPKNASRSVLSVLSLGDNRNTDNTKSLVIYENHQRASVLASRHNLSNLFVFCFCRNPYDRCVSWFKFHKGMPPYSTHTFDSWVKKGMPFHYRVQNLTNYMEEGLTPLLQYTYIEGQKVDFIGRLEHFFDDLVSITEKLNSLCADKGIPHRFVDPKLIVDRSYRRRCYEDYYTQRTKDQVYSLLKKDFDYFGYDR